MNRQAHVILAGGLLCSPLLLWAALPGRFSFWPLLFLCLVPLFYWIADSNTTLKAARKGVAAGIIIHLLQLYWIVSVLTTFGRLPVFVAVPALFLLAVYMGLYMGLLAAGFYILLNRNSLFLFLAGVPALWVGLDWVRSWLFGGFPWMDIGYGFSKVPWVIQAADLCGHYGYTFLTILINCALFVLVSGRFKGQRRYLAAAVSGVLICTVSGYSFHSWKNVSERMGRAEQSVMGIVQGNVEQGKKWSPEEREETVKNYLDLSAGLTGGRTPEVILWPETAMPFYPHVSSYFMPVREFAEQQGLAVLTGAPWYDVENWEEKRFLYYNSAVLLSSTGEFDGLYHKSHLVPYGEYVPLKKYMPFITPLVEMVGDFTAGRVEQPLSVSRVRMGVLICYESIFGTISRDWVVAGANVLVNLTNDAWYGKSSAPYQSWAMTVFRAVETRRSLVRSANTGISGMVDPLGRVVTRSDLFLPWSAAVEVPLMEGKTFFVRSGWLFAPVCLLFGVACCLLSMALEKREEGRR